MAKGRESSIWQPAASSGWVLISDGEGVMVVARSSTECIGVHADTCAGMCMDMCAGMCAVRGDAGCAPRKEPKSCSSQVVNAWSTTKAI